MTPAERARLAALAEAATPGPWEAVHEHAGHHVALVGDLSIIGSDAAESSADNIDAAFIAASRAAVPELLAALADAEAERDRLRERVKLAEAWLEAEDTAYRKHIDPDRRAMREINSAREAFRASKGGE